MVIYFSRTNKNAHTGKACIKRGFVCKQEKISFTYGMNATYNVKIGRNLAIQMSRCGKYGRNESALLYDDAFGDLFFRIWEIIDKTEISVTTKNGKLMASFFLVLFFSLYYLYIWWNPLSAGGNLLLIR